MKNRLALLIGLLFLSINSFAQINFEKGYFIDNSGKKTDCLIKNIDWKNNPKDFKYKLLEGAEEQQQDINSTQEFCIGTEIKYVRFEVQIDRSSLHIDYLTTVRNPQFQKDTLFLKSMIEGKANLYYYEEGDLRRFFYRLADSTTVQQLIYKKYKTQDNQVSNNNYYRHQLLTTLVCEKNIENSVKNAQYIKEDMIKLFAQYNECMGSKIVRYIPKKKRSFFFSIRPCVSLSSLSLNNDINNSIDVKFNNISFRIGGELEWILPFNKNKWAIIVEPTFQYFTDEANLTNSSNEKAEVIYKSIEIPIGLRYYMFLNKESKFFLNSSFIIDRVIGSSVKFNSFSLELESQPSLSFGAGYSYANRISLELRGITPRSVVNLYNYWGSAFQSYSFILGIKI